MPTYLEISKVAGGIEISDCTTVKKEGANKVVGELSEYNVREKYLKLKCLKSSSFDKNNKKHLMKYLKLLNHSIPVTFSNVVSYNVQKKPGKVDVFGKVFNELNKLLNMDIDEIIKLKIEEYNFYEPVSWVIGDMIKFLSNSVKRLNNEMDKIKVDPEVMNIVNSLYGCNKKFKYCTGLKYTPKKEVDLLLKLISSLNIKKSEWLEPKLIEIKKPCFCSIKKDSISKDIEKERKLLKNKVKKYNSKNYKILEEYTYSIINIEKMLLDMIKKHEYYYIDHAKNLSKIFDSIKHYVEHYEKTK